MQNGLTSPSDPGKLDKSMVEGQETREGGEDLGEGPGREAGRGDVHLGLRGGVIGPEPSVGRPVAALEGRLPGGGMGTRRDTWAGD